MSPRSKRRQTRASKKEAMKSSTSKRKQPANGPNVSGGVNQPGADGNVGERSSGPSDNQPDLKKQKRTNDVGNGQQGNNESEASTVDAHVTGSRPSEKKRMDPPVSAPVTEQLLEEDPVEKDDSEAADRFGHAEKPAEYSIEKELRRTGDPLFDLEDEDEVIDSNLALVSQEQESGDRVDGRRHHRDSRTDLNDKRMGSLSQPRGKNVGHRDTSESDRNDVQDEEDLSTEPLSVILARRKARLNADESGRNADFESLSVPARSTETNSEDYRTRNQSITGPQSQSKEGSQLESQSSIGSVNTGQVKKTIGHDESDNDSDSESDGPSGCTKKKNWKWSEKSLTKRYVAVMDNECTLMEDVVTKLSLIHI